MGLEIIFHWVEILVHVINLASVGILIIGASISIIKFIIGELTTRVFEDKLKLHKQIKIYLGSYILLALELLIAADIIETVVQPSINDLIILGGIVTIRTVIAYFLQHEIEEDKNNLKD